MSGFNLNIGLNFGGGGGAYGIGGGGGCFGGPSLNLGVGANFGNQFGNDGFNASAFLNEGGGAPMGGCGFGMNNPMMGLGSMGGCNPRQMFQEMRLLSELTQLMGGQGSGGPCGGAGPYGYGGGGGGGQFPGQFPGEGGGYPGGGGVGGYPGGGGYDPYQQGGGGGNYPYGGGGGGNYGGSGGGVGSGSPYQTGFQQGAAYGAGYEAGLQAGENGGPNGPGGVGGPGGGQGGTIELQKGNSFTTPGGATINWTGDTLSVNDPNGGGGAQASPCTQGAGPSRFFGSGAPGQFTGEQQGTDQKWNQYGDPHITNPDGSTQNNQTAGSQFTLSDGTKILTNAGASNSPITSVQIVLPGARPNYQKNGQDPSQTTIYKEQNGKFVGSGTANQYMGGGFGQMQNC